MLSLTKDEYGIVCQREPSGFLDGGDSVNWTAHYLYMTLDKDWDADLFLDTFESLDHPGLFVRHPDPEHSRNGWASYCNGPYDGVMSRDQLTGVLCYLGKEGKRGVILDMLIQHSKRGFLFAYNTIHNGDNPQTAEKKIPDITLFDIWALFIRGLYPYSIALYPLLVIFDIHLLCTAILKRFSKDNDIISFFLKCVYANERMPTPVMWLVNRVNSFKQFNIKIHQYWSGWRNNQAMYAISIPFIHKYMRG